MKKMGFLSIFICFLIIFAGSVYLLYFIEPLHFIIDLLGRDEFIGKISNDDIRKKYFNKSVKK